MRRTGSVGRGICLIRSDSMLLVDSRFSTRELKGAGILPGPFFVPVPQIFVAFGHAKEEKSEVQTNFILGF